MKWIFQRFFSPLKCATYPGFSVRHAPDSLCDIVRIQCATCSGLCTCPYNGTAPALVFGLQDLPTVRAQLFKDTATLAARRSLQDLRTVDLPCPVHHTSGRRGVCGFEKHVSRFGLILFSSRFSSRPRPPLTQTVGLYNTFIYKRAFAHEQNEESDV